MNNPQDESKIEWNKELNRLETQKKQKDWNGTAITLSSLKTMAAENSDPHLQAEVLYQQALIQKLQHQTSPLEESLQALLTFAQKHQIDTYLLLANHELGIYYANQKHGFREFGMKGVEHLRTAIKLAEPMNDYFRMCEANFQLGNLFYNMGEHNRAESNWEKSVQLARNNNFQSLLVRSCQGLALINTYYFRFTEAIRYLDEAKQHASEANDSSLWCQLVHNTSFVYGKMGDYSLAIKYAHEAMMLQQDAGMEREVSLSLINLGVLYGDTGEIDKAKEYLEKSKTIVYKLQDKETEEVILANLAMLSYDEGKYEASLSYWEQVFNIIEDTQHLKFVPNWYLYRGVILLSEGYLNEAESDFFKAYEFGKQVDSMSAIYGAIIGMGAVLIANDTIQYGNLLVDIGLLNYIKLNSKDYLGDLYKAIAISYLRIDHTHKAKYYLDKAIHIYQEMNFQFKIQRTQELLEILSQGKS